MYEEKKGQAPRTYKRQSPARGAKPKPRVPVALKDCTVILEGTTVELVKGQSVEGLTRQEQAHLKKHKFIK